MGKIKLPKSLLRVLFPKSKKKKDTVKPNSSLLSIPEHHKNVDGATTLTQVVKTRDINKDPQDGSIQAAPSTSPTIAETVNIVSMQFSFDDYDDASFASVKDDAVVAVEDSKPVETDGVAAASVDDAADSSAAAPVAVVDKEEANAPISSIETDTNKLNNSMDDEIPSLQSSPIIAPLPQHSSPAAQRARAKALARQKRILSQCEERLNALTGTAVATLEEATSIKSSVRERQKEKKEKQLESKLKLDLEDRAKVEKQFSTIVFYERNPDGEIHLFDNEQPSSPLSTATTSPTNNDVIDTQGFPLGTLSPHSSSPIPFFVLLLDPKSRIFELIEIDNASPTSTVGDVLNLIPSKCSDERLLSIKYTGLCRPSDKMEFTDPNIAAFTPTASEWSDNAYIMEKDVLVAILADSTGYQMCKISKPILKNGKFREMIRRRGGRKSMEITDTTVEIVNDMPKESSVPAMPMSSGVSTAEEKKERYNTLCEKLESLSRKLHRVDEEILAGEVTVQPQPTSTELTVQIQTNTEVSYRMSPKMVATELAQHIEDIFADHDVEILAVDADDDSDDGTFVSARSHKSVKSIKSKKIETKRKSPRQSNLFESNEENALALQIEAMAVQAEEAFGNRHGRKSVNTEDVYEVPEVDDSFENMEVIPEEMESADILDTMKLLTRGSAGVDVSNCTLAQKEAFSRNFLNTSTSMVSTMVAATHGRVNEVHVLQYLGCTIVCIAANFAQQRQEKQAVPPISPNFGARQVFQSAMFLAFMVNGQRYLAKVTKK